MLPEPVQTASAGTSGAIGFLVAVAFVNLLLGLAVGAVWMQWRRAMLASAPEDENKPNEPAADAPPTQARDREGDRRLRATLAESLAKRQPCSMLVIEVQFPPGERSSRERMFIAQVAASIRQNLRDDDSVIPTAARHFLAVLPDTNSSEGSIVAERLRANLAEKVFHVRGSDRQVTVSVGVATAYASEDFDALESRAGQAQRRSMSTGCRTSWIHSGETCKPVDAHLRSDRRYAFAATQRIAPYVGGRMPSPSDFEEVECRDLSAKGLSYLSLYPPECEQIIVALGDVKNPSFRMATIKNSFATGTAETPMYRIGCEFTAIESEFSSMPSPAAEVVAR